MHDGTKENNALRSRAYVANVAPIPVQQRQCIHQQLLQARVECFVCFHRISVIC